MRTIAERTSCPREYRAVTAESSVACPDCRRQGVIVRARTVKALLTQEALARLGVGVHRLCESSGCPVVYYDDRGGVYHRQDVHVDVWHKEPFGSRMICYCFGETEQTIRMEFEKRGQSEAVERVRAHIDLGRCACDVRNPRGVCCLDDLAAAVEQVGAVFGVARLP